MNKRNILYHNKIPTTSHKYVGIEIEFISPKSREAIIKMLCEKDLQNNCTIKGDGSLSQTREIKIKMPEFEHDCSSPDWNHRTVIGYGPINGFGQRTPIIKYNECSGCTAEDKWVRKHHIDLNAHELTILTIESELRKTLNLVNLVLMECKAEVNKSCGLHVHLDMRKRDFKKSAVALLSKQKEFRKMVAKDRLKNDHCKPLKKIVENPNSRYNDINLCAYSKFGTIEVRIHEGTVNTSEIHNWCKYLISIVDNKKVSAAYVKRRTEQCA